MVPTWATGQHVWGQASAHAEIICRVQNYTSAVYFFMIFGADERLEKNKSRKILVAPLAISFCYFQIIIYTSQSPVYTLYEIHIYYNYTHIHT